RESGRTTQTAPLESAPPMSPADFFAALRRHLSARNAPYHAADLLAWAEAVWPIAEVDPDPARWADAYAVALAEVNRLAAAPEPWPNGELYWRRVARRVGKRLVWLQQEG